MKYSIAVTKFQLMKRSIVFLLLVFSLIFLQKKSYGQITYGSNNGQYVQVYDTKLYYEIYGNGTPLLLLHGGLGSIANFKNVIPELSRHFKVIALDSPGHGRSEYIDSLSYEIMADYVVRAIEKLDLDSVYIAGFSDGAITGLLAAHDNPEKIKRVVFGAGALSLNDSTPEGIDMLRSVTPRNLPESFELTYKEKSPNPDMWEIFVSNSKAMWLQDVWIPKSKLKDIKSRTLILFGDRDPYIPFEHGIQIYNAIPKSEFCVLPNTLHNVFNDPEIVNSILINFLSQE